MVGFKAYRMNVFYQKNTGFYEMWYYIRPSFTDKTRDNFFVNMIKDVMTGLATREIIFKGYEACDGCESLMLLGLFFSKP